MDIGRLLLFLVFGIAICQAEFCPLESDDCTQQPSVPCIITRDPDCKLSGDWSSRDDVTHYPGPVMDFTVKSFYLPPTTTVSRSRVTFNWRMPENGTHVHLKAIEVKIKAADAEAYCFYFNYSGATWGESQSYQFELNCSSLDQNGYTFEVNSLPKAPFSDMKASAMMNVVGKQMDKTPETCNSSLAERRRCWDTDIIFYLEPCLQRIRVTFTQAPDDLNIPYYHVSLIHNLLEIDTYVEVSKAFDRIFLEGTLDDVIPPKKNRKIKIIPKGSVCAGNICRTSSSSSIDIIEATEKECTFIPPYTSGTPTHSQTTTYSASTNVPQAVISTGVLVGIILAAIVLAALITLTIVMVTKKRWIKKNGTNFNSTYSDGRTVFSDGSNNSRHPIIDGHHTGKSRMPRVLQGKNRKIFILYSNDNKDHKNVVCCYGNYLNHDCFCDVILDMGNQDQIRTNKHEWIKSSMENADFILIINSEGTYKKASAFLRDMHYPNMDNQFFMGDMFTPAFEILQKKLSSHRQAFEKKIIQAHFSYTRSEYKTLPLEVLMEKVNYKLMTHNEDLFYHIHGIEPLNPESGNIPQCINELYFNTTDSGEALSQAILNASCFIAQFPDWFNNENGVPRINPMRQNPTKNSIHHPAPIDLIDTSQGHSYSFDNPNYSDVRYPPRKSTQASVSSSQGYPSYSSKYIFPSRLSGNLRVAFPEIPDDIQTLDSYGTEIADFNKEDSGVGTNESSARRTRSGNNDDFEQSFILTMQPHNNISRI